MKIGGGGDPCSSVLSSGNRNIFRRSVTMFNFGALNGAHVGHNLQIHAAIMLVIGRGWVCLQRYNVYTKFRKDRSAGSEVT